LSEGDSQFSSKLGADASSGFADTDSFSNDSSFFSLAFSSALAAASSFFCSASSA
jgi:hypothetical protein